MILIEIPPGKPASVSAKGGAAVRIGRGCLRQDHLPARDPVCPLGSKHRRSRPELRNPPAAPPGIGRPRSVSRSMIFIRLTLLPENQYRD